MGCGFCYSTPTPSLSHSLIFDNNTVIFLWGQTSTPLSFHVFWCIDSSHVQECAWNGEWGLGSGAWLTSKSLTPPGQSDWIKGLHGSQSNPMKYNVKDFYQDHWKSQVFFSSITFAIQNYVRLQLTRSMIMQKIEGKERTMWNPGSRSYFKILFKIWLLRFFSFWFHKLSFYSNHLTECPLTGS